MNAPVTPTPAPVVVNPNAPTRKVKFASIGTYLAGVIGLSVVQAVSGHLDVISAAWPWWVQALVTPLIPAAVAFLTGYVTKHAPNDTLLPTK